MWNSCFDIFVKLLHAITVFVSFFYSLCYSSYVHLHCACLDFICWRTFEHKLYIRLRLASGRYSHEWMNEWMIMRSHSLHSQISILVTSWCDFVIGWHWMIHRRIALPVLLYCTTCMEHCSEINVRVTSQFKEWNMIASKVASWVCICSS